MSSIAENDDDIDVGLKPVQPQEMGLNNMPNDILTKIFLGVDSVTRKRSERVCKRWRSILRSYSEFKQFVKIDLSSLPPVSRLANQRTSSKDQQENARFEELQTRLHSAMRHLVIPEMRILYIMDSSLPVSSSTLRNVFHYSLIDCSQLFDGVCQKIRRPFKILLDRVAVCFENFSFARRNALGLTFHIKSLELRQVPVIGIRLSAQNGLSRVVDHLHMDMFPSQVDLELLAFFNLENGPLSRAETYSVRMISEWCSVKEKGQFAWQLFWHRFIPDHISWNLTTEAELLSPFSARLLIDAVGSRYAYYDIPEYYQVPLMYPVDHWPLANEYLQADG